MLRLRVAADPLAVRAALLMVRDALAAGPVHVADPGIVELALAEVMNNVVEHGNADGECSWFRLSLHRQGESLAVALVDRGPALPAGVPPPPGMPPPPQSPATAREGGYGWPLIHLLCHDIRYRRMSGQNVLCFRLPAGPET